MSSPTSRTPGRLPRRFPVGATYVVEGYGGEEGNFRVIARYVVLPAGGGLMFPPIFRARRRRVHWLSGGGPIPSNRRPKASRHAAGKKSPRSAEQVNDKRVE